MKATLLFCLLLGSLFSYAGANKKNRDAQSLEQAIKLIQANYFFYDSVLQLQLDSIKAEYKKSPATCNYLSLINECFKQRNDGHSSIHKYDTTYFNSFTNTIMQEDTMATGCMIDSFAYINIPGYGGLSQAENERYVDSLQGIIATLLKRQPLGWIIDLRKNSGGNGQVMIEGLGPLLGDGIFGYMVTRNGKRMATSYCQGKLKFDRTTILKTNDTLQVIKPRIIILTSEKTGSSGEWVAVALKGKAHATIIGKPTHGISTAPNFVTLKNGAVLSIAVSAYADCNGVVYGKKVMPDVAVELQNALPAAIELMKQK